MSSDQPNETLAITSQKKMDNVSADLKVAKVPKSEKSSNPPKRLPKTKQSSHADMVIEAIRSLNMKQGAPVEDINKYLEENYEMDIKSRGRYVSRFLKCGSEKGILEEVGGNSGVRFKTKKTETVKKEKAKPKEENAKAKAKFGIWRCTIACECICCYVSD